MKAKHQAIVNQVGKPDGIESYVQFRYHWVKEVVLDYFERIQGHVKHFSDNR